MRFTDKPDSKYLGYYWIFYFYNVDHMLTSRQEYNMADISTDIFILIGREVQR